MRIAVGTKNKRKIETVQKVLKQILENKNFEVDSYSSNSGVPDTPWGEQTYNGAHNRAIECRANIKNADYYIGLESGLVERYGQIYEEAWACVIDKADDEFFGYSSGLKVPTYIVKKMEELKMEHCDVMGLLDKEENRIDNDDTWGTYSKKMIIRDTSLEESLRNALIQVFAPKNSYYNK